MPVSRQFIAHVTELLAPLGDVRARAMFGGYSVALDGRTFALVAEDTLYVKADDLNRDRFIAAGLRLFAPFPDRPDKTLSYYAAPDSAFDDPDELLAWARLGLEAASRAKPKSKPAAKAPRKEPPAGRGPRSA